MNITRTKGDKVFDTIIIIIVSVIAILFLFPLLNVLASSFSSADAIVAVSYTHLTLPTTERV